MKIKLILIQLGILFLLQIGYAETPFKGSHCLEQYDQLFHNTYVIPGTHTYQAFSFLYRLWVPYYFSKSQDSGAIPGLDAIVRAVYTPTTLISIPFRMIYDFAEIGIGPSKFFIQQVRKHRYGKTFELLLHLENVSNLVNSNPNGLKSLEEFDGYKRLVSSRQVFIPLMRKYEISEENKLHFVLKLLKAYEKGSAFCGVSDRFQPIRLNDLKIEIDQE